MDWTRFTLDARLRSRIGLPNAASSVAKAAGIAHRGELPRNVVEGCVIGETSLDGAGASDLLRGSIHGPMLSGLNHITFAVRSLARSLAFYEKLGAVLEARWNRGAFLTLGGVWLALLEGDVSDREHIDYSHIAWSVAPADYSAMAERIQDAGGRIWSENVTPGDSLFFMDPDGHRLELHAGTLEERLAALDAKPPEGYRRGP